jgi:hypothetical protein
MSATAVPLAEVLAEAGGLHGRLEAFLDLSPLPELPDYDAVNESSRTPTALGGRHVRAPIASRDQLSTGCERRQSGERWYAAAVRFQLRLRAWKRASSRFPWAVGYFALGSSSS